MQPDSPRVRTETEIEARGDTVLSNVQHGISSTFSKTQILTVKNQLR